MTTRFGDYVVKQHEDGKTATIIMDQLAYTDEELAKSNLGPKEHLDMLRKGQLTRVAQNPDAQGFEFIHRSHRAVTVEKDGKEVGVRHQEVAIFARRGYFEISPATTMKESNEKTSGRSTGTVSVSVSRKDSEKPRGADRARTR